VPKSGPDALHSALKYGVAVELMSSLENLVSPIFRDLKRSYPAQVRLFRPMFPSSDLSATNYLIDVDYSVIVEVSLRSPSAKPSWPPPRP
jgi:hypothetical protein